jgi:hypothetical protein
MADLSPASQAVYDAYCRWADNPYYYERSGLVAALRAAADQWRNEVREQPNTEFICGIKNCIDALDEIAAELEESDV